jgi:hypothetical protein
MGGHGNRQSVMEATTKLMDGKACMSMHTGRALRMLFLPLGLDVW